MFFFAASLHLGLQGVDHRRVQIFIEAELPLDERNLSIHSFLLIWRREKRVESDSQATIDHIGDNLLQDAAGCLEARVRVNLDQVDFEVFVEHEIEAEDLERMVLKCPRGCYY